MIHKIIDSNTLKYAYTVDTGDIVLKRGDAIIIHTGSEYESATVSHFKEDKVYVEDRWEYSKIFNKYPDKSIEDFDGIKKIEEV